MSTERVTLADVAADAGVHAATVSRALSRPDLVGDDTLERVNAAVARLGYVPNRAARQLAGGPTSMIAVLVPDLTNPFFASYVQAAQRRAGDEGLLTVLGETGLDPRRELEIVRSLASNVDGLLLAAPVTEGVALEAACGTTPRVLVNRRDAGRRWAVVDQRQIVSLAVDHLRSLGHTRIGVVGGPQGYWSSAERLAATDDDSSLVTVDAVDPTFAGGRAAWDGVQTHELGAVVCFNDMIALGLIAAATADGVDVPAQLSVVGSDDIPLATMVEPALTTVGAPIDELADASVALLVSLVDGTTSSDVVLEPYLVERGTTAPPPETSR